MKENTMTENTQEKVHKDGRSWDTYGPYATHESCASRAKALFEDLNALDFESKIKHLSDGFFLKIREKQSSIDRRVKMEAEYQASLAEQKKEKKEKKQLNKKQRD